MASALMAEEPTSKNTPSLRTILPLSILTLELSPITAITLSRICSRTDRRTPTMVSIWPRSSRISSVAALRYSSCSPMRLCCLVSLASWSASFDSCSESLVSWLESSAFWSASSLSCSARSASFSSRLVLTWSRSLDTLSSSSWASVTCCMVSVRESSRLRSSFSFSASWVLVSESWDSVFFRLLPVIILEI